MSQISEDFYTAAEVAAIKKVTLKTVYNWVLRDKAPKYEKFAGCLWFHKSAVKKFKLPKRGRPKK